MQHRDRKSRKWAPVVTRAAAVQSIINYTENFDRLEAMHPLVRGTMLQTITRASAWYTVCRAGVWYAGPSKFAGCDFMTPELYEECRKAEGGIEAFTTTAALNRFADGPPVPDSHPAYKALESWAARFDREPKKGFTVQTISDIPQPERVAEPVLAASEAQSARFESAVMSIDEESFIALVVSAGRGLSTEGRARLMQVLAEA